MKLVHGRVLNILVTGESAEDCEFKSVFYVNLFGEVKNSYRLLKLFYCVVSVYIWGLVWLSDKLDPLAFSWECPWARDFRAPA